MNSHTHTHRDGGGGGKLFAVHFSSLVDSLYISFFFGGLAAEAGGEAHTVLWETNRNESSDMAT